MTDKPFAPEQVVASLVHVVDAAAALLEAYFYYDDDPPEANRLKSAVTLARIALPKRFAASPDLENLDGS